MKTTLIWAALFGLFAVITGAFGAHSLKAMLSPEQLSSFETGVRYQMYHALLLVLIGVLQHSHKHRILLVARNLIISGIFLFSFSIYALNLQEIIGLKLKFLGPVTPLGGLLLITGWLCLLMFALKSTQAGQK
jgi:uncharacterized membrane protein YgdD (TMEM256/DUF423 family)